MSTPNDNHPKQKAKETRAANTSYREHFRANRAAPQPQPPQGERKQLVMVGGELQMRVWNPVAEEWDYSDVPALAEYAALQAQRDELLGACKEALDAFDGGRDSYGTGARLKAAIARATEGQGQ